MGKSLKIYNASAGSGKTYTLVKEYLRLILKDNNAKNFSSVLAMTFTNKAANEMKERVIAQLKELAIPIEKKTSTQSQECAAYANDIGLTAEQITERAEKSLNAILHNYGLFSVMTIDKFTHKVIRTFARELGLSLDFDVELDLKSLRQRITDLLFEKIGRDEDLTKLMIRYAESKLEDDQSWDFSRSLMDFTDTLFKEHAYDAIRSLSKLNTQDFIEIQADLRKEQERIMSRLKKCGQDFLDFMDRNGITPDDFNGKAGGFISIFLKMAEGVLYEKHPTNTQRKIANGEIKTEGNGSNAGIVAALSTDIVAMLQEAIAIFEESKSKYYLNDNILKKINNLSLLNHLMQIVESIKEEDNILLISDFYKKISEVIIDEPVPFIYERLGVRYEHFLLDEFQDTSRLQWMNLIPLVHNSLAQGNTNLIVGDGKQAIYRWRSGDVHQFVSLPDYLTGEEEVASIVEAKATFKHEANPQTLGSNYRSSPVIVNFNNDFFEQLIGRQSENIQKIYKKLAQHPEKKFDGRVEAKFDPEFEKEEQCEEVLAIINRALEKGYDYKDICIICRKNAQGNVLSNFLTDEGVKVTSPDSLYVGNDVSVKFLTATIKAHLYPNDKNAKIKFFEHLTTMKALNGLNAHDISKPFFVLLDELGYTLKGYEKFNSLYSFIEHMIRTFELVLDGNPYLQYFLEQVHQYEKKNSMKIAGFLNWFNAVGRTKSIVSPEGANAVQIMTVHKSKGLQFPIVICPMLEWLVKKGGTEVWVSDDQQKLPAFPLTVTAKNLQTQYKEVIEDEDEKILLDGINLLYVMFTRAEKGLFMLGKSGKPPKNDSSQESNSARVNEKLVLPILKELPQMQEKNGVYWVGSLPENDRLDEVSNAYDFKMVKDVIAPSKLSLKGLDTPTRNHIDDRKRFGTSLHLLMSRIDGLNEVDQVLQQLLNKRKIEPSEVDEIKETLNQLKNNEEFKLYFQYPSINEKEIIDELGKAHIPDKIIFKEEELLVVDFKTGEPHSDEHQKQVQQYIKLLQEIYPDRHISGDLFYTQEGRAISVGAE